MALKAARRRCTGGGTLAKNGDDVGTVRTKRKRVGGVVIFTGGGAAFNRAEAKQGRPGAFNGWRWRSFNAPRLKAPITRGLNRGGGTV
jgi:hypothetical protein